MIQIDGHLVVQFYEVKKWWTCSKANNNNDGDFAVWPESPRNSGIAATMAGTSERITTPLKPIKRGENWYVSRQDRHAKTYIEALCAIARTIA